MSSMWPSSRLIVSRSVRVWGGVAVAAVAGVDYRHAGDFAGSEGSSLDRVAHRDDVGEASHHAYGVLHGLSLAHGRVLGVGESEHGSAEFEHGGSEAESGAGAGLIEQRGELAVRHPVLILLPVGDDVFGEGDYLVGLLLGQVCGVDQMFHSELRNSMIFSFHSGAM